MLTLWLVNPAGLTETCGSTTLAYPDEMCMLGTVGPVSVYNEMRLEEVPEMGYNPLGSPSCGEICLRGKTVFTGYYKNPELTREAIKDGWFHTGWLNCIFFFFVLNIYLCLSDCVVSLPGLIFQET